MGFELTGGHGRYDAGHEVEVGVRANVIGLYAECVGGAGGQVLAAVQHQVFQLHLCASGCIGQSREGQFVGAVLAHAHRRGLRGPLSGRGCR